MECVLFLAYGKKRALFYTIEMESAFIISVPKDIEKGKEKGKLLLAKRKKNKRARLIAL